MFSIFTLAIKFDCLFLTIFQSFHLFVGFIFDKLAPPLNICFKRCFKSLFSPLQCVKQSQKCLKRSVFPILHFGRHGNRGGGATVPPPATLATLLIFTKVFVKLVKAAKASHHVKFYNLSTVPYSPLLRHSTTHDTRLFLNWKTELN